VVVGDGVGSGLAGADAAAVAAGEEAGVAPEVGGIDPVGVGVVGVLAHAATRTPRRRDAARRLAFISRRLCCGLGRR
jgi:hypothetical protein